MAVAASPRRGADCDMPGLSFELDVARTKALKDARAKVVASGRTFRASLADADGGCRPLAADETLRAAADDAKRRLLLNIDTPSLASRRLR